MHGLGLVLTLLSSNPSAPAALDRVLVLPLSDKTGGKLDTDRLSAELVEIFRQSGAKSVWGAWDVEALIEGKTELDACENDATCVLEIVDPGQASYIVTGQLGPVGGRYLLHLALIDPKTSYVQARAGLDFGAPEQVHAAMSQTVDALLSQLGSDSGNILGRSSPLGTTGTKISFVVLDFRALGVSEETAAILTHELTREVKLINGSRVYNLDDLKAIMDADKIRMLLTGDCESSCLNEIAGALGADYLVTGSVGRLGTSFHINLSLIDQAPARMGQARRVNETYEGSEDDLARAVGHAARKLLGVKTDLQGKLRLKSRRGEDGEFFVNGRPIGEEPIPLLEDLQPGRHSVKLVRSGYYPHEQDIYVGPGGTTQTIVELEEIPWEWHKSWWVWTLVGAAVVGGTVVGTVALQQDPDPGTVRVGIP